MRPTSICRSRSDSPDLLGSVGFTVRYTRKTTKPVELEDRVHIEHLSEPDLFLSLHCNSCSSPGVQGLEVFTSIGTTLADQKRGLLLAFVKASGKPQIFCLKLNQRALRFNSQPLQKKKPTP